MAAARTRAPRQGPAASGRPAGPTNPTGPASWARDLGSVFAPFDRLGKPGDPSYVAGTGGDGQTQQGNQTGTGQQQRLATSRTTHVYSDFYDYALTTLDRAYVPISVKDYVRDYFSSLDPSN